MLTASCINRAYKNGGHIMMAYATSSPAATTGGGQGNNNIPVSLSPASSYDTVPVLASVITSYRQNSLTAQFLIASVSVHTETMATFADHDRGTLQPVCQNCTTSTTPLWRRDEIGSVLCNACGLFLKLHGTPRPISLKTDVIKSRNRVKTASQAQKKKVSIHPGHNKVVLT